MGSVFYGAAIGIGSRRGTLPEVHARVLETIASVGHRPVSEHIRGRTHEETQALLSRPMTPQQRVDLGWERRRVMHDQMIAAVEGEIVAAIFEFSEPSLCTGIEFTHAYLRPRIGLLEIPILGLYQTNYWNNGFSSIVSDIMPRDAPGFRLHRYETAKEAADEVRRFLTGLH